jgi:hypothetical protein
MMVYDTLNYQGSGHYPLFWIKKVGHDISESGSVSVQWLRVAPSKDPNRIQSLKRFFFNKGESGGLCPGSKCTFFKFFVLCCTLLVAMLNIVRETCFFFRMPFRRQLQCYIKMYRFMKCLWIWQIHRLLDVIYKNNNMARSHTHKHTLSLALSTDPTVWEHTNKWSM